MSMLNRSTNGNEQLQTLSQRQMFLVAILRDRNSIDQFHHEVGASGFGRAAVEHTSDIRMLHHRQRLPFGLEPGDNLVRVHTGLNDLQGDASFDRLFLLGHVNDAHAPFADLLQQFVGADLRAGFLGDGRDDGDSHARRR
jgi:hypothetical protein